MSSSLLSIGTQALTANQSALAYTGQNIANVNTEGYSRQRVNFETQSPPILGVAIQDVQRITDQFLVEQVWRDQSALSSSEQRAQKIELLDKLMVSDSTSLSTSMDDYFAAMQKMVDDPLFIANRQLFLAEAESLVNRFQNFDTRLKDQLGLMNTESRSMMTNINSITGSIAALNVKISGLASGGQNYNSLIDERDTLVKELSKYISVDVISSDGGITANINLSNGEPLVVAGRAASLAVRDGNPDPLQLEVYLKRGAVDAVVTDQLGEGALGGLFTYRDEVLQPVVDEVGRLAIVFADKMNEQHRKGMDLNGDLGIDLFTPINQGSVYADRDNKFKAQRSSLTFYDSSELQASQYKFRMIGVDKFEITRLSDGKTFESSSMQEVTATNGLTLSAANRYEIESEGTETSLSVSIDGFTFRVAGSRLPAIGDEYLLKPTADGARSLNVAISNPKMLAMASPIRVEPLSTNTGNAVITDIQVTDARDTSPLRKGTLEPPLEIRFNADGTFTVFDISEPGSPVVFEDLQGDAMADLPYVPGQAIEFATFALTLDNQPKPGDAFTIEYNTNGYSDNRNARQLADLQKAATLGEFSFQDIYGQLLARVGTQANAAKVAYSADQSVLSASEDALASVAGVNLDEEAARLIQYQQAYTASTRMITAYQDIFDSLMSAVR